MEAFLKEGVVMKKFDHAHVLRLLGVGIGENDEPMVVLPYMANGDLRTYVRDKEKVNSVKHELCGGNYACGGKIVNFCDTGAMYVSP